MSIQEHLNKIRNAVYGHEVRESIAKGIETAYDDASEKGNANMEVSLARGTHPNLRSRLEEVDDKQQQVTAQLAQNEGEIVNLKSKKADQSFVDSQLASIVGGVFKGKFTNYSNLVAAYPNGAEGIFLVLENGHWYYWNESQSTWLDGGVFQGARPALFPATNVIPNGNFDDRVGWTGEHSEVSAADNTLTNTASGANIFASSRRRYENVTVGHKYYIKGRMRVTNGDADYIAIAANGMDGQQLLNNPNENQWYDLSGVFTVTSSTIDMLFRHKYNNATLASGKQMELQYAVAINLTTVFGAGFEPIKSELDSIMGKFPSRFFANTEPIFYENKEIYQKIVHSYKSLEPLSNLNQRGLIMKNGETYLARQIMGTNNQISVSNGNGVNDHPRIGIPTDATPLRPEVPILSMGNNISPEISAWSGQGATWNGDEWVIDEYQSIYTTISVESGKEYEIDIKWSDTNSYNNNDFFPKLFVTLGSVKSNPEFTGFSDALYTLALKAEESGEVELRLGNDEEPWSAKITDVIVRAVNQKVTRAGRIGIGGFDVYTQTSNLAIGRGHKDLITGRDNYAYGLDSQRKLTVGNGNVAMGTYAQELLESGIYNTGLGHGALRRISTGCYNTSVGYSSLAYLKDGNWNVALGNEAARDVTTGNRNTALGSRALFNLTTGNNNVAIGRLAAVSPKGAARPTTTAGRQVVIGVESGQATADQADHLTAIGFHAIGAESATALGAYTEALGKGSVAIGIDNEGGFARAANDNEFVLGTDKHHVKVVGKLNVAQYTPEADDGEVGDFTSDDNHMYVKTAQGWKKVVLETVA